MKIVLLLLLVLAVWWLWRSASRRSGPAPAPRKPHPADPQTADPQNAPETIVACAHCGLHLPRGESLPGRGGVFCSEVHRAAFEAAAPR